MLKIVLADNQTIFRAGAAKSMAVEDDLRVVAQAQSGRTAHHGDGAVPPWRFSLLLGRARHRLRQADRIRPRLKTKLVVVAEMETPGPSRYTIKGILGCGSIVTVRKRSVECIQEVAKGQIFVQDALSPRMI